MSDTDSWRTLSVAVLPPGHTVTFTDSLLDGDMPVEQTWTAVALLNQLRDRTGATRVVLGVLNPHRGDVEPFDVDAADSDGVTHIHLVRLGVPR